MATLTYTGDDGVIGHVTIDADQPNVKIGRHKECAIRTDNGTVSRRHCQIVFSGTDYKVFDLGSSNGTYYQRKRIAEHVLQSGDVFHCGNRTIGQRPELTTVPPLFCRLLVLSGHHRPDFSLRPRAGS